MNILNLFSTMSVAMQTTNVIKLSTNTKTKFVAEIKDIYGHYNLTLVRSGKQVKQHMTKISGTSIPNGVNRSFDLDFYKWEQEHLINGIEASITTKIACL